MKRHLRQTRSKLTSYSTKPIIQVVRVGLGILILGIIIAIGGIWLTLRNHPWTEASFLNFLIVGDSGLSRIITVDRTERTFTELLIPNQTIIPVSYGYGNYRIEVLADLGKQEGRGLSLLEDSTAHWLGISLDGVIEIAGLSEQYTQPAVLLVANTTLSLKDKIWLALHISSHSWKLSKTIHLQDEGYLNQTSQGLMLSNDKSTKILEHFVKDSIVNRPVQIVVVNTTKTSGLATETAKLLMALGYDVVNLKDEAVSQEKTSIKVVDDSLINSDYVRPLRQLMNTQEVVVDTSTLENYRGEVVIILGKDYAELIRAGR